MEGRRRRAQSLKLERRASPASWSKSHGWRWPRLARRWGSAIVSLKVPRGLGSSGAAILLLASVSYGVVKGGHGPQIAENFQNFCDSAANSLGFRISEIVFVGEQEIRREEILTVAGVTGHSSLLFLDAAHARARLLTNPWIADATVLKLYPDRLRIEIKERKPFALWQQAGQITLIAADGTVLESTVPQRFATLPLVVGKGAGRNAQEFLALIARYPAIARMIEASVLVAERRWNLHLKNGVEVLLPEADTEQALRLLVDLDRSKKLLSREIVIVDLRLADRVTVRLSDTVAAGRERVPKNTADKAKKARPGKGGEA